MKKRRFNIQGSHYVRFREEYIYVVLPSQEKRLFPNILRVILKKIKILTIEILM